MLVLSRRTNETLVINNDIRFTVLSVSGNQVRIGIEAPENIIILREEIINNGHRTADSNANGIDGASASATPRNHSDHTNHGNTDHHGKVGRRGVLGLRRRRPS